MSRRKSVQRCARAAKELSAEYQHRVDTGRVDPRFVEATQGMAKSYAKTADEYVSELIDGDGQGKSRRKKR